MPAAMPDWTVLLAAPNGEVCYEIVSGDLVEWNGEEKTLDFLDTSAAADFFEHLMELSKKEQGDIVPAKADIARLLRSFGAATSASFDRTHVIGYFRGRRAQP